MRSLNAVLLLFILGGCGRLGFGNTDAGVADGASDTGMDAIVDAPMDAPFDVPPDVLLDAAPDVPLPDCVEEADCPECQTCNVTAGMCEPIEDGTACGVGATCRSGACCGGCWAGGTCVSGFFNSQCGAGGGICTACESYDMCGAGVCVPAPRAVGVAVGRNHACLVRENGDVLCWGDNTGGQLGLGATDTTTRTVPTVVVGITGVSRVVVGDLFTCALIEPGELHCWGGSHGAAGAPAGVPTRIGITLYRALAASELHACAITTDGTLLCWGEDTAGELGHGTFDVSTPVPTRVGGESDWGTITAGPRNTCGSRSGVGPFCWGDDTTGALGRGCMGSSATPQLVGMFDDIWAGTDRAWARVGGGATVMAWGDNTRTALGTGTAGMNECIPRMMDPGFGSDAPRLMVSGDTHGCAITVANRLYCWGDGSEGALGLGDLMDAVSPTRVGTDGWRVVSAGGAQTCAVNALQEVQCWGQTFGGATVTTPTTVPF